MRKLTRGHLEFMNFGRRYWDASLDKLTPEQRSPELMEYLSRLEEHMASGVGIALHGPNSTGKTFILAALCKEVWSRFRFGLVSMSSYFVSAEELRQAWLSDRVINEDYNETLLDRVHRIPFLAIDDLGKEYHSDRKFSESCLGNLIRYRSRNLQVTSFSFNLGGKDLREVYGKSLVHLLVECTEGVLVDGPDMRKAIQEKRRKKRK